MGDAYLECRSRAPEQGRWMHQALGSVRKKIFQDCLGGKGEVGCSTFTLEPNGIHSKW